MGLGYDRFGSEGRYETGVISNSNAPTTVREQNASSFYAELIALFIFPAMKLPWARLLEMQLAGRHEHRHNKTINTKLGVTVLIADFRFMPHRAIMLRASYGKGYVVTMASPRRRAESIAAAKDRA
ncbi:MAG: hypothetical protein LBR95_01030 [Azoarcus sp.]|jgi:hypothetical protein|nr:hypothetical protein [Azoarcus sp.]